MDTEKTFETSRLRLLPTSIEDAPLVLELLNTPKWLEFIGDRNVHTLEEAQEYIQERMLPQLERLGYSNYTILRKTDGVKLGTCGLYDREGLEGIDIGFALLPQFEGKGYGLEAAQRLKDAAHDNFGIKELLGITSKENLASQALLKKLGFNRAGTVQLPNDTEELILFRT